MPPFCERHRNEEVKYLCECEGKFICEKDLPKHTGLEHKKLLIDDLGTSYSNFINDKLKKLDDRMSRYSTTIAGKVNYVLTEYINGMHTIVDEFKDYLIKKYNLVKESFGPFSRIDDLAEEVKNISNELEQTDGIDDDTMDFVEQSKKLFAEIDKEFDMIQDCNQKAAYMEGEVKTDLRDELSEFKNYIEDLFLTFRCPYSYEDHAFSKRTPGMKNQQPKVIIKEKKVKEKTKSKKDLYMAGGEDDISIDLFQDFEIVEG